MVNSGLQSGQAFSTTLSHAQQNELIRRNETRAQQGKDELTELAYRQEKGIDASVYSGTYQKPTLRNNSYSSANNTGEAKISGSSGSSVSQPTTINNKVSLDQAANGYVAKTSGKPVQQPEQPKVYAQGEDHTLVTYAATESEKQKLAQEYSQKLAGKWDSSTGSKNSGYISALDRSKAEAQEQQKKSEAFVLTGGLRDAEGNAINQITNKWGNSTRSIGETGQEVKIITPINVDGKQTSYSRGGKQTAADASQAQFITDTARQSLLTTDTEKQKQILSARQSLQESGQSKMGFLESKVASAFYDVGGFIAGISKPGTEGERIGNYLSGLKGKDVTDEAFRGVVGYNNLIESGVNSLNTEWGPKTSKVLPASSKIAENPIAKQFQENLNMVVGEDIGKAAGSLSSDLYNAVREKPASVAWGGYKLVLESAFIGGAIHTASGAARGTFGVVGKGIQSTAEKIVEKSAGVKALGVITKNEGAIRDVAGVTASVFNAGAKTVDPVVNTYFMSSIANGMAGLTTGKRVSVDKSGAKVVNSEKNTKEALKEVALLGLSYKFYEYGAKDSGNFWKSKAEQSKIKAEINGKQGDQGSFNYFYDTSVKAKNPWTVLNVGQKVLVESGKSVGLVRGSVRESDPSSGGNKVTERSRGSIAEEILYGESPTIHVTRGSQYLPETGKTVSGVEGALNRAEIFDSSGNLVTGRTARNQAIESIQRGESLFSFNTNRDPLVGTMHSPVEGFYASTGIKGGVEPVSLIFTKKSEMTDPNRKTWFGKKIQDTMIKAVDHFGPESTLGKVAASIGDTEHPGTRFNPDKTVNMVMDVRKVQLPDSLKLSIREDISKTGGISDANYKSMIDIGQKQVVETGEPIAIIPPKTREGWTHQENEVFILTDKASAKVSGISFSGFTEHGIKTMNVSLGKQTVPETPFENYLSNLKYNLNLSSDRFALEKGHIAYNARNQAGEEQLIINQRVGELYNKDRLSQPGAWEFGMHGTGHTENVHRNIIDLAKSKNLEISEDYLSKLALLHDVSKIGAKDNAISGWSHGITAARAVKAGKTGLNEIDTLPVETRARLARDIAYHEDIKPLSSGELIQTWKTELVYRPSIEAKLLANADRLDLARYGLKVDADKLFRVRGIEQKDMLSLVEGKKDIKKAELTEISKDSIYAKTERVNLNYGSTYGNKLSGIAYPYAPSYREVTVPEYKNKYKGNEAYTVGQEYKNNYKSNEAYAISQGYKGNYKNKENLYNGRYGETKYGQSNGYKGNSGIYSLNKIPGYNVNYDTTKINDDPEYIKSVNNIIIPPINVEQTSKNSKNKGTENVSNYGKRKRLYRNRFGSFEQFNTAMAKVESKNPFNNSKLSKKVNNKPKSVLEKIKW